MFHLKTRENVLCTHSAQHAHTTSECRFHAAQRPIGRNYLCMWDFIRTFAAQNMYMTAQCDNIDLLFETSWEVCNKEGRT